MAEDKKVGLFGRMGRSFRDMRGEMKRVVWPSRKQVINNTVIVLVFMVMAAVLIGVFDIALSTIIRFSLGA